jgi:hypothetical protein
MCWKAQWQNRVSTTLYKFNLKRVKFFIFAIKHGLMKTCGEVKVLVHAILISEIDGNRLSALCHSRFASLKGAPGTHWSTEQMDKRIGLNTARKTETHFRCQKMHHQIRKGEHDEVSVAM